MQLDTSIKSIKEDLPILQAKKKYLNASAQKFKRHPYH